MRCKCLQDDMRLGGRARGFGSDSRRNLNLSLPPEQALDAISRLMVAINRINDTVSFPRFMIMSPRHGDELIPMAAILAVAEIEKEGDPFNEAFRLHAQAWMRAFAGFAPEVKTMAELAMATAWRALGRRRHRTCSKSQCRRFQGLSDTKAELMDRLPRNLRRLPS